MTDTKQLKDEELKQVTGGAWVDDNDLTQWRFSKDQVLYGRTVTPYSTPSWTITITIKECIEREGKPWYKVHLYDQVFGPRDSEWSEAYLTGKTGEFELV